jgi:uncharacterized protein YbjT (DUF2867 family)
MSQKPLVVVSGATGVQGGSIINSLLATGHYKIRGLTRNPDSDKAKALSAKGVEVVKCDLSAKDDVKKALKDADIAWIVTNFWDPSIIGTDVGEEERQGKMIADVAKETGLNWLIYSSTPDTITESGGKIQTVHFAGKNRVEQYIRTLGIPNATFIYLGFYFQNVGNFVPLVPKENGEVEVVLPYLEENNALPMVDAENDTGPIVVKIIEDGPSKWNGKKVPVAAEYITMKQIADTLSKVTGKTHKFRTLSDEDIAKEFPSMNHNDFKQTFKWHKEYGYYGKDDEVKDISIAKKLHPNIKTYEQYLSRA